MTGFNPYDRIDLHSPAVLERLIPAIIRHENGAQPYSREQILRGISDSVYDPRWSRLRDRNTLYGQRQSGSFELPGQSPRLTESSQKAFNQASLFAPDAQGEGSLGLISEAMSKAIDENKFQLEITLVNPQTGERRKVQTEGGGRVALSDAIIELNRHGGFFVLENLWL
ncbi:hypothetical protein [Serratia symbiotica]|uniref:hypothetical protein n=1 Tax=Serratia symbiotica TaxID=138074 RepID=UPI00067FDBBE|nr:hypothetical protein [Serratia symbiotica]